jgi:hypothetical protein
MSLRLHDEHRRSKRSPDRSAHIVRARLVRPETSEIVIKQAITTMWIASPLYYTANRCGCTFIEKVHS